MHIVPDSPHERLKWARIRAGYVEAADFARALSINPVTYRAHELGQNGFSRKAAEYGKALGVSADWLLVGGALPEAPKEEPESNVEWVPVIGLASAGAWREAVQVPEYLMPMPKKKGRKSSFAVEIDGDSMDKILPEGGWAVVDVDQRTLYDGRVYLIQNSEYEATIKRYHSNPARYEPVSHNTTHETIMVGDDPIQVIGRIVAYGNDRGL